MEIRSSRKEKSRDFIYSPENETRRDVKELDEMFPLVSL